MNRWQPPWAEPNGSAARLVVTSTTAGLDVHLEVSEPVRGLATWLRAWMVAYLGRMPDQGRDDPDFSFAYVVLGATDDRQPDGRVDGSSVLEAGYGGDPAGPPDSRPTTLAVLLGAACDALL